ncbi:hypothetical protein FF1_017860 [Malus domestica]
MWFVLRCCLGFILVLILLCFMAVFTSVLLYLLIALAVVLLLFPIFIIAHIAYCFGYTIDSDQAALTHDIESGRELMITTTPHRQLRLWCYVIFSYLMSKKSELLCIGGDDHTICLETFEEQDKCVMLGCRHVYHRDCIEMWLDVCEERLCPICHQEV